MSYRSEVRRVRDTQVHLLRGGRGAPLLVLHPEFASGRWFSYHDELAASFQVIAPDHPGFGKSERPEWVETVEDLAFFYLDLLDELALETSSLLGISFGGWVAAELAALAPHRFERLVLAGAAGLKVEGAERFDLFAQPLETTLQRFFHDTERWIALLPADKGPEGLVEMYREASTLARLSWNPYWYDPKLPVRLRRVTCPALVIWGANDRFLSLAHGEAYVRLLPRARLATLSDCGHLPLLERPKESLAVLLPFLRE
jgi:pimeloyl-ACP methyl ester carboxylesterase